MASPKRPIRSRHEEKVCYVSVQNRMGSLECGVCLKELEGVGEYIKELEQTIEDRVTQGMRDGATRVFSALQNLQVNVEYKSIKKDGGTSRSAHVLEWY